MRFLVGLTVFFLSSSPVYSAPLDDAKTMLESGKAAQAYEILQPLEGTTDDPETNYLLGIAALDSGHAAIALFAFQRVLAADPNHIYARAEMGRALLRLHEFDEARAEFARVRSLDPPPELANKLAEYEQIIAADAPKGYKVHGFLDIFSGFDSNYASATEDQNIGIPAFGNLIFTLDEIFVEDDSYLIGGRGGVGLTAKVNPKTSFVVNASIDGTAYPDSVRDFYHITARGNIGFTHTVDHKNVIAVAMNGYGTRVLTLDYLRMFGFTAAWTHYLNEHSSISSFLRYADLDYDKLIDFRDVRQYLAGVSYSRKFSPRFSTSVNVFGGTEQEVDDTRPDAGRDLIGVGGNAIYLFTPKIRGQLSVSGQFSEYNGDDTLFLKTRDDDQFRVAASLQYKPTAHWMVRPEISYTDNSSNIPTSDYDRFIAMVTVRRLFN